MVTARRLRVAVLGGNGRFDSQRLPGCRVRVYQARRYGGNGPLRRLEESIRSGGVDRVRVLARWNAHSSTTRIVRLCRQLDIPVEICP